MTSSTKKSVERRRLNRPILAVTPGEPGGIGPEITAHLFARFRPRDSIAARRGVVRGARAVARAVPRGARGGPRVSADGRGSNILSRMPRRWCRDLARQARHRASSFSTPAAGTGSRSAATRPAGDGTPGGLSTSPAGSRTEGLVEGIVTGPLSKNSLDLGGYPYTGHTEFLSRYFNAPDCQMVMAVGDFRVVPLTRHIPLSEVAAAITARKLVTRAPRREPRPSRRDFGVRDAPTSRGGAQSRTRGTAG